MGGNGSLSGFLDEGKDKTVRNENKNTHNINDNRHNMNNLGGTINRNNSNEAYYGQTNLNYSQIVSNLVMQNYGGAGFDIQQNSSNLGNKGFPGQYNSEQGHQTPFYQPQVVAHNSYPSQQSTYQSSQLITTSAQAPSSYYSNQSNIQQYRPQFNSPHKVTNFNSNRINYWRQGWNMIFYWKGSILSNCIIRDVKLILTWLLFSAHNDNCNLFSPSKMSKDNNLKIWIHYFKKFDFLLFGFILSFFC